MKRLTQQARALENQFFYQENRELVVQQQALAKMERSRDALAEVSGITNPAVLDKLIELEVAPEMLATLAVLPLVQVAWADGRVQDKEREAILAAAGSCGIAAGSVDHALLEQWLRCRPPAKLLEAWTHYVSGLCENLSEPQRATLADDLLSRARAVAQATGKLLGLTSGISATEEAVIARIRKAFADSPA
jgi:uncharacterized tellurite resistance protein B-like protein